MRAAVCGLLFAPLAAHCGEIMMTTFDGDAATTQTWNAVNDPVMGGQSTATFRVDKATSVGVFSGETKIVPSLKAPGFCNMQTRGAKFPDISAAHSLKIVLRGKVPYSGYKVSFGPAPRSGFFSSYKADFNLSASTDFQSVIVPFNSFSSRWSGTTGEPDVTCAENKTVCPDASHLAHLTDFEFNMEGVAGKFDVEIKSISALTGAALASRATQADQLVLATFDGAKATSFSWSTENDPVMGGQSESTFSVDKGAGQGVWQGEVKVVPSLGAPGFCNLVAGVSSLPTVEGYDGLVVRARAVGSSLTNFNIQVGSTGAVHQGRRGQYTGAFALTSAMEDHFVPWSAFECAWRGQNVSWCPALGTQLADIDSLRLGSAEPGARAGPFQLDIVSISAAKGGRARSTAPGVTVFDFAGAPGVKFYEVNDPVMGGASVGTFSNGDGFGRLNGTVNLIPSLGAPGFIKALTCLADVPGGHFTGGVCKKKAAFPDVSALSRFVLRARSSTPSYAGFKFSFGPVPGGGLFSFGYKADFNATKDWSDVVLPFDVFSGKTSGATGEPTKTCAEDPSACPTQAALAGINDLELWAEGHAGAAVLDVQTIKAE